MRLTWDEYFMNLCHVVSERSTCNRKHVGAIIVKDKRPIATGYNGSLQGLPHCDDPEEPKMICPRCGSLPNSGTYGSVSYCHCNFEESTVPIQRQLRKGGHEIENGHCVRTVHAEVNAIAQAAKLGISTESATIYINTFPCWNCFKTIVSAGITEIVYKDEYESSGAHRVNKTASEIPRLTLRRYLSK